MKNIFIALLFAPLSVLADNLKTIQSSIQSVTVYQQGAQIHRKAYFNVSKGLTVISLENISKRIDPKSIQVNGTGNIIILDSKYKLKYPKPLPVGTIKSTPKLDRELIQLNDSITNFDYDLAGIKLKLDVLNAQKNILNNNGSIKGIGKVNDSIPLLKDALNYFYNKMNSINEEVLALTIAKNKIKRAKSRISDRIQVINTFKKNQQQPKNNASKPASLIEITVSANQSASGRLEISYMVKGAGWSPLYDINSSSAKNNVDLTYKAQVYQNTGIDWVDANLTLSTTNPYSNKTKPTLSPFYIHYYQNLQQANRAIADGRKKALSYKTEIETLDETNASGYAESDFEETSKEIISDMAYNYVELNEQMISVEYQINLPYSILSNNEQHLVLVRQESLKSNYKYYTIPKLEASAYLVAELSELDDLNLIPGTANIFHDGTYIGETSINPSIMSDSLALSLGKDQNIQIKRTLLKKDSKTKVIGDKTIKTYAYFIEIKNHKSTQLNIVLQDQVPITQNSEIEIEIEEISKGNLNEITGIIDWNLKLKPKETKAIKLIYTVSSQKGKQTNLAQN